MRGRVGSLSSSTYTRQSTAGLYLWLIMLLSYFPRETILIILHHYTLLVLPARNRRTTDVRSPTGHENCRSNIIYRDQELFVFVVVAWRGPL